MSAPAPGPWLLQASGGSPGLALRTTLLWLLCALGAAFLSGWWGAQREQLRTLDTLGRDLEVHALALRGATEHYRYLPYTAAQHPAVLEALRHSGQGQAGSRYLEDLNRQAGAAALYLMNTQGQAIAASNWRTPQSFVGQNYANRPYFQDALRGQAGHFYGVGLTTGEPGYFLSTPVYGQGQILGVMVVKVDLRQIQNTWAKARSPVLLLDERGIVLLGSEPGWLYHATREVAVQERAWLQRHAVYGASADLPLLGWEQQAVNAGFLLSTTWNGQQQRFVAVGQDLPELGWTLVVTADRALVAQARNRWALTAALAALALALLARLVQVRRRQYVELERMVQLRTQDLRQAHAFRKSMEDSLLVGMRARDLEGRTIYVNQALCDITGYAADALLGGLAPYPYWHPDDMEKHWQDNANALSGQSSLTGFETRFRHQRGHDVYAMVYTAPLIDADGKHTGWMSSVVDITAQKQERALREQQQTHLHQVQRRALMEEMAATLAHEINQPLMAIGADATAARKFMQNQDLDMVRECLEAIDTQKQRASQIVLKIREHVHSRTRGKEPCDMNALIQGVLDFLRPELQRHKVEVRTQFHTPLPAVQGDRVLLEQVVLNLSMNAIQAMRASTPRQMLWSSTLHDGSLRLQLQDTGPGIDPEVAKLLFKEFVTTKPDGLGAGLSICRTIIENHGGQLRFSHPSAGGACFCIELPCPPLDHAA